MKLLINGDEVNVPDTITTIKGVIGHFNISNPIIIVEHNDAILEKHEYKKVKVTNGDKIELIQFVGGG